VLYRDAEESGSTGPEYQVPLVRSVVRAGQHAHRKQPPKSSPPRQVPTEVREDDLSLRPHEEDQKEHPKERLFAGQ